MLEMKVLPGTLHKGGYLNVQILLIDESSQTMNVELDYQVIPKALVPIPAQYLEGKYVVALPLPFQDERGYIELERAKKLELKKASVEFVEKTAIKGLQNGYKIRVTTINGRSVLDLYYHPSLPELGWGQIELLMSTNLPIVGNYILRAELK